MSCQEVIDFLSNLQKQGVDLSSVDFRIMTGWIALPASEIDFDEKIGVTVES